MVLVLVGGKRRQGKKKSGRFDPNRPRAITNSEVHEEKIHLLTPHLHCFRNRNHGYLSRLSPQAIRLWRQACLLPYVEPISYLKYSKTRIAFGALSYVALLAS